MFMHSRYLLPRLCANFVISPRTDNRAALDFIPSRWLTWSLSMQLLAPYYIAPGVIFIATSAFIFNTGKTEGASLSSRCERPYATISRPQTIVLFVRKIRMPSVVAHSTTEVDWTTPMRRRWMISRAIGILRPLIFFNLRVTALAHRAIIALIDAIRNGNRGSIIAL